MGWRRGPSVCRVGWGRRSWWRRNGRPNGRGGTSLLRPARARREGGGRLALERVFDPWGRAGEEAAEFGFELFHGFLHFPGDGAVTEVAFDAAADAADVFGFGEVHFEEEAAAGAEGEKVFVGRRGEEAHGVEGMVHGGLVFDGEVRVSDDLGGFVAELAGVVLAVLLAAAVAVEVAVGADVHDHVVAVEAAAEATEEFVVFGAGSEGGIDDLLPDGGGGGGGPIVEGAEGPVGDGVEESRGDFGGGIGGFEEVDIGAGGGGGGEVLLGPEAEGGGGFGEVGVGVAVFGEGGGEGFGLGVVPAAGGGFGAGGGDFGADGADLGVGGGFEAADLFFEGADAGDLADVGGDGPEEEVAGDVEGAGSDVALVGVGLHVVRAGELGGEMGEGCVVDEAVGGEESLAGGLEGGFFNVIEFGRNDEAGLAEVLIAGGFGLAVPELFVFGFGGGEFGDAFEAEGEMAEVSDGGVPVLEVEAFEELGGVVGADPIERLGDGVGGAAVAGEGVGALFGSERGDGEDAPFGRGGWHVGEKGGRRQGKVDGDSSDLDYRKYSCWLGLAGVGVVGMGWRGRRLGRAGAARM